MNEKKDNKIKEEEDEEITEIREKELVKDTNENKNLELWIPKTELGKKVKNGEIKSVEEIFKKGIKIMEAEIIDKLVPNLKIELVNIGQAKGKFGGGKRRPWRQTQKKTAEGNIPTFVCMVVVGDENGYVGIGYGKAKETVPAKQKAIRNAKLNLTKIKRGCGSFECVCNEEHSIPFIVEGKMGSVVIKLIPAPKGTGLVADNECKKLFRCAGIKDIYSKSFGQTRTKINMIKATFEALKKLNEYIS